MSIRTIIELNSDYMDELEQPENFKALLSKMIKRCHLGPAHVGRSGDVGLPGIRVLGKRHHSEPEWGQERAEPPPLRDALAVLVEIIDAAKLLNLSRGVELGPTVWYVKAHDRLEAARDALTAPAAEPTAVQAAARRLLADAYEGTPTPFSTRPTKS